MKNDLGSLYFVHSGAQGAVKVGFAVNPTARLASLQTGNPGKLSLGSEIPIHSDAEAAFHDFMKPHRIAREWYPSDELLFHIEWQLADVWAEKVEGAIEARVPWPCWAEIRDNPQGIYLTAADMKRALRKLVREYFEDDPDDPEPVTITNHWTSRPAAKRRRGAMSRSP